MENKDICSIDYRFKILYAVGMIMVVCGHCDGGSLNLISDWFPYGGIHLSLFVFSSGYFYKSGVEDNLVRYLLKKIKILLVPLYIYTVIYGIIVQISRIKGFSIGADFSIYNILVAPINHGHQFIYNMGGWFIIPLFMVEIINAVVRKIVKSCWPNVSEWIFWILFTSLGCIGNELAYLGYYKGWWLVLVRMLYFLPFYEIGILYHSKLEKYDKKISTMRLLAIVFGLKLLIVYNVGHMVAYTPSWCNDFSQGPVLPILVGYLGIALWFRIASISEPIIGRSKWVNLIADNTYSIMMNQFVGFMFVKAIFGLISKYYVGFSDFDWVRFKSEIWYYYKPNGIEQTLILYAIAGIVVPIIIQKIVSLIMEKYRGFRRLYKFN